MKAPLTLSSVFLIVMNLIPLWGVFHLGWDAGQILVLYWLENVIYGLINIPKIFTAQIGMSDIPVGASLFGRSFLVLFFILHYGLFTLVHGVFVSEIAQGDFGGPANYDPATHEESAGLINGIFDISTGSAIWVMLGGLAASHLLSLAVNWFGRGEWRRRTPNVQMMAPYFRVVILHIVILFGGALVIVAGSPLPALFLLIGLKTVIDLIAHIRAHRETFSEQPA